MVLERQHQLHILSVYKDVTSWLVCLKGSYPTCMLMAWRSRSKRAKVCDSIQNNNFSGVYQNIQVRECDYPFLACVAWIRHSSHPNEGDWELLIAATDDVRKVEGKERRGQMERNEGLMTSSACLDIGTDGIGVDEIGEGFCVCKCKIRDHLNNIVIKLTRICCVWGKFS